MHYGYDRILPGTPQTDKPRLVVTVEEKIRSHRIQYRTLTLAVDPGTYIYDGDVAVLEVVAALAAALALSTEFTPPAPPPSNLELLSWHKKNKVSPEPLGRTPRRRTLIKRTIKKDPLKKTHRKRTSEK